ncbi:MAG: hypothetical protein WD824_12335 [Cyclobacteriaceae bacterium]
MKKKWILFVAALICFGCNNHRSFYPLQVNNPALVPDSAFVSFEDLTNPKFQALKEKYQLDTIFHGEQPLLELAQDRNGLYAFL